MTAITNPLEWDVLKSQVNRFLGGSGAMVLIKDEDPDEVIGLMRQEFAALSEGKTHEFVFQGYHPYFPEFFTALGLGAHITTPSYYFITVPDLSDIDYQNIAGTLSRSKEDWFVGMPNVYSIFLLTSKAYASMIAYANDFAEFLPTKVIPFGETPLAG